MSVISVFLPPEAGQQIDPQLPVWRVTDNQQQLPFAQALPEQGTWRLILPVEQVAVCAANLPTRKPRLLAKALPFAVEELLAEEVEHFHLCVGAELADGRHRVYALRRDWLAAWLALCTSNPPSSIEVDADLLDEHGTLLLCLEQRYLLGGAGEVRLAVRPQDWPAVAAYCPQPVDAYVVLNQPEPEAVQSCQLLQHAWVWLAAQPAGCNLAQGEFAVEPKGGNAAYWKPLLAIAGLWLLLQWTLNVAQLLDVRSQAQAYAQANHELYQELFPQDTRVVNVKAQFDQHLASAQRAQGSRLFEWLAQVAQGLRQMDRVELRQIDFNQQRGDLALSVHAGDFAQLEALRQYLQAHSLEVDMGSATREQNGVGARLVIGAVR